MKRLSFCLSVLIFWLIGFSTLFSLRVEQWMTPVVTVLPLSASQSLPLDCLQQGKDGSSRLFYLEENKDLSSPQVVAREFPTDSYQIQGETLVLSYGYGTKFIQYASKGLEDGYPVSQSPGSLEPLPDVWLVCGENASPQWLDVPEAEQPFLQGREESRTGAEHVYSLREVSAFFEALPRLALLPGCLFLAAGLWGSSLFLAKSPRKNRGMLFGNILAALTLLAGVFLLSGTIDLPSSLLPENNLLEGGHYVQEFSEIFSVLKNFAGEGGSQAQTVLSQAYRGLWLSLGALLLCALMGVAIPLGEQRLLGKRHQTSHRQ